MNFIIETYGCQMNVADSELITSILITAGYKHTVDMDQADIIIFNTCSIREHAEVRVIGRIANEVSRKINNKNLLVGIVGCMAQRLGEELHKINKKIDFVVGVDQYLKLPEIINAKIGSTNIEFNTDEIYTNLFPVRSESHNAFITIMRGCDNYCSYCIVPYTRGRERSRPVKEILNEVKQSISENKFEITLLGQNVNSYNHEGNDFPDLLKKVNEIDGLKRIRFITSHPKDLSDKLIETMATCEKVCEHVHLPMQSGNSEILNRMNRKYTSEHYRDLIKKLRQAMPNIAITTDVIAGFPGESEEQFLDTYNMMKEIQFDFAFMFKYSERSGTKAIEFNDSVPEEVRLERLQRLIDQQCEITTQVYKSRIGREEEIYVECVSKKNKEEISGKTKDFKITVFEGDETMINKFVKVKIIDATGWTLKGRLL